MQENNLTKLLALYPNKPWNWEQISSNPNIDCDFVEKNSHLPWDWVSFSKNPNLTWKFIEKHPKYLWDWYILIQNPCITWDIINQYPHEILKKKFINVVPWNLHYFSYNPNLTLDIIQSKPLDTWNWVRISMHPNITWEIIEKYSEYPWDWSGVSRNPNITWNIIEKNPNHILKKLFNGDAEWKWYWISRSKHITWDIIESNPKINWHWVFLSNNPNITLDIVKNNLDLSKFDVSAKWDWQQLASNSSITLANVFQEGVFKEVKTYSYSLSLNPNLTWEIVHNNKNIPWNWTAISSNTFGWTKKTSEIINEDSIISKVDNKDLIPDKTREIISDRLYHKLGKKIMKSEDMDKIGDNIFICIKNDDVNKYYKFTHDESKTNLQMQKIIIDKEMMKFILES